VRRRHAVFGTAAAATVGLDQLGKALARGALDEGRVVEWIPGFWSWFLAYNPGMSFGLLRDVGAARWLLLGAALVACAAVLWMLRRPEAERAWIAAALGLVFGGALGNGVDRVLDGRVTDFVLWRLGDLYTHNPFNLADAALVAGIAILVLAPRRR
jgi:signal peptidase II